MEEQSIILYKEEQLLIVEGIRVRREEWYLIEYLNLTTWIVPLARARNLIDASDLTGTHHLNHRLMHSAPGVSGRISRWDLLFMSYRMFEASEADRVRSDSSSSLLTNIHRDRDVTVVKYIFARLTWTSHTTGITTSPKLSTSTSFDF